MCVGIPCYSYTEEWGSVDVNRQYYEVLLSCYNTYSGRYCQKMEPRYHSKNLGAAPMYKLPLRRIPAYGLVEDTILVTVTLYISLQNENTSSDVTGQS